MSNPIPFIVGVQCPACQGREDLTVDWTDYMDWEDGTHIDVAFDYLADWERRLLDGGLCQSCWEIING